MTEDLDQILNGDTFDSRDLIARFDELEVEYDPEAECQGFTDEEEQGEFKRLGEIMSDAEGYSEDFRHGATFIRDSYFKTYAQEFASDIGAIDDDARWPNDCIDWDKATRELQMDYTSIEIDGTDWWVR